MSATATPSSSKASPTSSASPPGHEIIRQRRRDLTLCRLTPDLIYDQMIAAGCARKLVFSWAGNPGAGSLHAFRRAVEGKGDRRSSWRSTPTSGWWPG